MTKKDFEAIAAQLKYVKPTNPLSTPRNHRLVLESMSKQWVWAVDAIADALATSNPRFDRARFCRAC